MENKLESIAEIIKEYDNYILIGHILPDGDCLGSMIALFLGLEKMGKSVEMYLHDPTPSIYQYLASASAIKKLSPTVSNDKKLIFLDCSELERVDQEISYFKDANLFINIDHHLGNTLFAKYNHVDTKAAATGEIIYDLLKKLNVEIDSEMAEALYIAIIMDTGNFQYSNTKSKTFKIAAELLDAGVDLEKVRTNLFESKSMKELALTKLALESIKRTSDGKIAWITLKHDEVNALGLEDYHPEGIISYARAIKGVEVGVLFREISPDVVKIGFRSKGDLDVSLLAAKFGGGGHKQASGAKQTGEIDEVINRVIDCTKEVLK